MEIELQDIKEYVNHIIWEFEAMQKAIYDCVNSPKGIVPDSALKYYKPHKFHIGKIGNFK